MEPNRNPSPDILPPRRPTAAPGRHSTPAGQRAVFSDFAPRPAQPVSTPAATPPQHPLSQPTVAPKQPDETIVPDGHLNTPDSPATSKPPREPHETAHSGWVGLVVFIILAAIVLFSPISGKIFQGFPGSSLSDSTGEQSIGCIDTLGPIKTSTYYNTKRGFPIVYNYKTTSTILANCGSATKTATGGHTSQFSPLGAVLDVIAAAIVAGIVAKIWRAVFSPKREKR